MRVCKTFQWDYAHKLELTYDSPCKNLHGHTGKISIEFEGPINENGMVIDFKELKTKIEQDKSINFDHQYLNDVMEDNPTSENIVMMLKQKIEKMDFGKAKLRRIRVWETPTSYAEEIF